MCILIPAPFDWGLSLIVISLITISKAAEIKAMPKKAKFGAVGLITWAYITTLSWAVLSSRVYLFG